MKRFTSFCIGLLFICPLLGDFKPDVATAPTLSLDHVISYGENEDQKITIGELLEEGLQEVPIKEVAVPQASSGDNKEEKGEGEKAIKSRIITNFDHIIAKHVKFFKEIMSPTSVVNNQSSRRFIFIEDITSCLTTDTTNELQALSKAAQDFLDKHMDRQETMAYSTQVRRKKEAQHNCFQLAGKYCFLQALRQKK